MRRAPGRVAACALLLLVSLAVLVLGCDAVTRYRVLSFFFDGVPPPPGVQVAREEDDDPFAEPGRAATTRPATRPGQPEELPFSFIHEPFNRRQCTECHVRETSFSAETAGATCRNCHRDHYTVGPADWVHGPVATGKCSMCHLAHRAQYPGLLVRSEHDLCFSCHQREPLLAGSHHQNIGKKSCSLCHDPHFSGNTLLIVDSGSYQRRRKAMPPVNVAHAGWPRSQCITCHLSERSFALTADVDGRCIACHGNGVRAPTGLPPASSRPATAPLAAPAPLTQPAGALRPLMPAPPGAKLHQAVVDGKCTACHVAHSSPLPGMVRPTAEQLCVGCHPANKLSPTHPRITRGECLLCHRGHSSTRAHLLREPGSPFLLPTTRPATQPATAPALAGPGARP